MEKSTKNVGARTAITHSSKMPCGVPPTEHFSVTLYSCSEEYIDGSQNIKAARNTVLPPSPFADWPPTPSAARAKRLIPARRRGKGRLTQVLHLTGRERLQATFAQDAGKVCLGARRAPLRAVV